MTERKKKTEIVAEKVTFLDQAPKKREENREKLTQKEKNNFLFLITLFLLMSPIWGSNQIILSFYFIKN